MSNALITAAQNGNLSECKRLLDSGDDLSTAEEVSRYTALHRAAEEGHVDVVQFLLEKGADPNRKRCNEAAALHDLVPTYKEQQAETSTVIARLLVAHGADVNAKDRFGHTALRSAMLDGRKELAKFLLASGADPNIRDGLGQTPLFVAPLDFMKLLIDHGADVNAADANGKTPLIDACDSCNHEFPRKKVYTLTSLKCDVNIKDKWGATAIMYAIRAGSEEIVRHLKSKGASLGIKTVDGQTPLGVAKEKKYTAICKMLETWGCMNEGTYEKTTNLSPNAVVEITGTYKCWWCETERVFNKGERFGECHSCDTKQAGGWHLVKRSEDTPPMTESKSTIDSKGKPWWSRWKFW
jgi:ankyrin repeat protein